MKITCTFYEYPAALHDINLWEELKGSAIHFKEDLKYDRIYYLEDEILICTPFKNSNHPLLWSFINKDDNTYNKTLAFGKITKEDASMLWKFMDSAENIKLLKENIV